MIKVTLKGIKKALTYLNETSKRAQAFNRVRVFVGSNLRYAYGIEFGKHRNGQLARRAGGAFMLRDAIAAVRPEVDDIFAGAENTSFDFGMALYRLGLKVQMLAMGKTPVRTGSLRRSMHTVREG